MSMTLIQKLMATAQAMGQNPTPEAIALMAADLAGYSDDLVDRALRKVRRKHQRFSVGIIEDSIQSLDGRPSVDAAWAEMPKCEMLTGVVTQDMLTAWGVAVEQYNDGDKVGAQIAFKREYQRLVDEARENGDAADWVASLGFDRECRDDVIIKGAAQGRLSVDAAKGLIGVESHKALAIAVNNQPLFLECEANERKQLECKIPGAVENDLAKSEIGAKYLEQLKRMTGNG